MKKNILLHYIYKKKVCEHFSDELLSIEQFDLNT